MKTGEWPSRSGKDEFYCRRGYWPIPKPLPNMSKLDTALLVGLGLSKESAKIVMDEITMLRRDIQAAKDRDQYRENLVEELKAERTRFREEAEMLKRRVTWFLSLTEGMLASDQITAILEETK